MKRSSLSPATMRTRIRIYSGNRMLGPGKAELLRLLEATGSLSAAAQEMGMSYMRAWNIVQELNHDPERPLVALSRGGSGGGGTGSLTPLGKKILQLYEQMDRASSKAARPYARRLARLLK